MKTYYSVDYTVQGIGTSVAWFDSKKNAVEFHNAGDYRDKPVAHRVSNQELMDERDILVAQTAEWAREREEEGETLLANLGWGGKRKGAGRPATGRELQKIYATDEEMMALRERLAELREEEKVTRNPGIE